MSLTSMDESSFKLKRIEGSNNLYLHLAKDGHWQNKVDNSLLFSDRSAFTADVAEKLTSNLDNDVLDINER